MGTPLGFREAARYFYLDTPLGPDKLLLRGFSGNEGISRLFEFTLDCLAENAISVDFDKACWRPSMTACSTVVFKSLLRTWGG